MRKEFFYLFLFGIVFLSGCLAQPPTENVNYVVGACIEKCKDALAREQSLASGPCLSNEIVKGWVCDVAHSPRQAVDDKTENQCSAYVEGKATHFVELDTNCKMIRAV